MADISKIQIENATYNIKDSVARNSIASLNREKRIVCIGDSYAKGSQNDGVGWPSILQTKLGLSNSNFYWWGESSGGFVKTGFEGYTFLTLLQAHLSEITNKDTITHVIVCGGTNDAVLDDYTSLLQPAITSFISYCNTQFPNAKVLVGFCGGNASVRSTDYERRERMYNNNLASYSYAQNYKNSIYMSGMENIMKVISRYADDLIHANNEGYTRIANCISQYINNGNYIEYSGKNIIIPIENSNNTFTVTTYGNGDLTTISKSSPSRIDFSTEQSTSGSELYLSADNTLANVGLWTYHTEVAIKTTSNPDYENYPARLIVSPTGRLSVKIYTSDNSDITDITTIYFYPFTTNCVTVRNPFLK